eukprot:scaffold12349_cov110-Skeletonema_dohrnii-CCMP3373.AAC.1
MARGRSIMVRWSNNNGVIHHRVAQPLKPIPPLRPPPIVPPSLNSENITELQRISNQQQRVRGHYHLRRIHSPFCRAGALREMLLFRFGRSWLYCCCCRLVSLFCDDVPSARACVGRCGKFFPFF